MKNLKIEIEQYIRGNVVGGNKIILPRLNGLVDSDFSSSILLISIS